MRRDKVLEHQDKVLKTLSYKIDDFYLGGGTALSLFYFHHRVSIDLDFFTPGFSYKRIDEIASHLKTTLRKDIELAAQSLERDRARVVVYYIYFTQRSTLKIDFIEDVFGLIKEPKIVDGIKVLSLEDIYLRKIHALIGTLPVFNNTWRKRLAGGRTEAKDFFDLYFLSHTFMPLCEFVDRYGSPVIKEGIITWYRTYDRMAIIDGIPRLKTDKKVDYRSMERHLREEVDRIIEREIEGI
jgi:predicted nucleotidyltransferase component of viral defense system